MKKLSNNINLIDISFNVGLLIKAINALIEVVGGFLMIVLNHEWLNRLIRLIAIPELREDPNDFVMNHIIKLGQNLSVGLQHSIAIYVLLHGTTKIIVIWLLWKKKMWAYLPAMAIFGLFIAYEIYGYRLSHSAIMLFTIIIDVAIVVLIILEYLRIKSEKKEVE